MIKTPYRGWKIEYKFQYIAKNSQNVELRAFNRVAIERKIDDFEFNLAKKREIIDKVK